MNECRGLTTWFLQITTPRVVLKCAGGYMSSQETFFCSNLKNGRVSFLGQFNVETFLLMWRKNIRLGQGTCKHHNIISMGFCGKLNSTNLPNSIGWSCSGDANIEWPLRYSVEGKRQRALCQLLHKLSLLFVFCLFYMF